MTLYVGAKAPDGVLRVIFGAIPGVDWTTATKVLAMTALSPNGSPHTLSPGGWTWSGLTQTSAVATYLLDGTEIDTPGRFWRFESTITLDGIERRLRTHFEEAVPP